ncbi:hypothetical protein [Streptomyces sp. NPDC020996]|uniref:hypothetical protein n=1 Tax=Streptomyces sp. NPDC020996 TaxID=3154791 RepID=UPI0033E4B6F5
MNAATYPDSSTPYAAVPGADKIVALDTEQLMQAAEYPTGDKTGPSRLACADGRLWFGYVPGPRTLTEYRRSDLSEVRTYPIASNPLTVSVAPDGTVAATVLDTDDVGDTYVFGTDPAQPASVRNLSHSWMPGGGHTTTWSADGSQLFVLTGSANAMRFQTVDAPRKYAPTLTVDAPSTATRAASLTVKGKPAANLALPAGTPLQVTRTDLESPNGKSLGTKPLGTGSAYSFYFLPHLHQLSPGRPPATPRDSPPRRRPRPANRSGPSPVRPPRTGGPVG